MKPANQLYSHLSSPWPVIICENPLAIALRTKAEAQELRDLLNLAEKLRDFAAQTDDRHYIGLFLATAQGLEDRAQQLVQGKAAPAPPHPAGFSRQN
jgi:hypothetical protein